MSERDRALVEEAVRVYRRYAIELVEQLGLCPYAEKARVDGRVREVVISSALPTDGEVLAAIEEIADDLQVEIGIVIFPRLELSRARLGNWVEHLRKAHSARRTGRAALAIEGFHPDAEADLSSPERLTPFVRRTPDPTLQLTRLSVLEHVRRGSPQGTAFVDPATVDLRSLLAAEPARPLHARIAERNHATVRELGAEAVRRCMDDVLRDRDAAYAVLDPKIPRRLPRG